MPYLSPSYIRGAVEETSQPVSMEERPIHSGDISGHRPPDALPPGLAKVLADMITSALAWEDAHGTQADRDKNGKYVTGPGPAGVSCPPRCGTSPDRDDGVGQGGDGDGVQGPATDVRRPAGSPG